MKWEAKVISFIVWHCTYGCRGGKSCKSKHHVCLCVKCVTVYPLLGKSSFIIWLCGLFITVNNTSCPHDNSNSPLFRFPSVPSCPPSVPQLNLQGNLSACRAVSRTVRAPSFISDRLILFIVRSIRENSFLWQHQKGKSRAGCRSLFKQGGSVNCALSKWRISNFSHPFEMSCCVLLSAATKTNKKMWQMNKYLMLVSWKNLWRIYSSIYYKYSSYI